MHKYPIDFEPTGQWEVFPVETATDSVIDALDPGAFTLASFDCPCNTNTPNTPDWENLPWDISIDAVNSVYTCRRCGRLFKLQIAARIVMYTPLAIRYPKKAAQP